MSLEISDPSEVIAKAHKRWKRNRDMVAGEDAVKTAHPPYLVPFVDQSPKEFGVFVEQTPFFPAAARTHEGLTGLVTRKPATLDAPANMVSIFEAVTRSGQSAGEFAEDVFSEYLITGYPGILNDFPTAKNVVNVRDAEAQGQRAFVVLYQAESILEVTPGIHPATKRQTPVRVRLLDDENTVRELLLVNGVYTVIIHRLTKEGWVADAPVVPTRGGKPLTEIPFEIAAPKLRNYEPPKAPLDDVCRVNVHIFRAQAAAQISRYFSAAPMFAVFGMKAPATPMVITPGKSMFFEHPSEKHQVTAKWLEFGGQGQKNLDDAVAVHKDEAAKLGSNILASERSAAEAAETHAIRRSSENSVLAGYARGVSRKIEAALDRASWWSLNEPKQVKFALNTDFVPSPMTPQDRAQCLAELQAGAISMSTFWQMLGDGEVLPEDFDPEWERQQIANDTALMDRPSGDPVDDDASTDQGE